MRERIGSFHSAKSSNFTKSHHLRSVWRDLSPSEQCIHVACVWDGSDAHPCFYPKGNCARSFLSRNLIFAFGSWATLPFIFQRLWIEQCECNAYFRSCNNTFLVDSWSAWLYMNPKQHFHWASNWGTLFIQELCFHMSWSTVGVYLGCTPKREARRVLF